MTSKDQVLEALDRYSKAITELEKDNVIPMAGREFMYSKIALKLEIQFREFFNPRAMQLLEKFK